MSRLDDELQARLESLGQAGLRRALRRIDSPQGIRIECDGESRVNFSSNDYLGLAMHPAVCESAARALRDFGAGSGASRLICGSLGIHHQLEERIARFKQTGSALTFSSGYATALGTIGALVGKGDVVIVDKLVHACVIDAVRLSGATIRIFKHNDLSELEDHLRWGRRECDKAPEGSGAPPGAPASSRQMLVIVESVYSMDGDLAPLRDIVELKERHGAWLMVDEAHGTGLFGAGRRGVVEAMELSGRVEIQMGTLGKALGASGGYIAGSRLLIDWLVNRARSFIFSTAPPPAAAGAALGGLEVVESAEGEELRRGLWSRVDRVKEVVLEAGWALPPVQSPILPLLVGEESRAMEVARGLAADGFLIPAIRYPTVARGRARLRLTVSASHRLEEIQGLGAALRRFGPGLQAG
ncbi:MAG TPA: 8-amino-7-oxononanoate synthase [Verrucomicrobiales bacterium]|nr:8-amino-7-oxononanoate synthase [Verrucomicrobiales bacterium]